VGRSSLNIFLPTLIAILNPRGGEIGRWLSSKAPNWSTEKRKDERVHQDKFRKRGGKKMEQKRNSSVGAIAAFKSCCAAKKKVGTGK